MTVINMCAPGASRYHEPKEMALDLSGDMHANTILIEAFNSPLSPMNGSSTQIINRQAL
jgi:hypothetical protein